jgi:hypothetical protein
VIVHIGESFLFDFISQVCAAVALSLYCAVGANYLLHPSFHASNTLPAIYSGVLSR